MNQDQIDSLARSACKIVGGILAAHGMAQAAAIVNSTNVAELIAGIVVAYIGMHASHTSNSTIPPAASTPATNLTPVIADTPAPGLPAAGGINQMQSSTKTTTTPVVPPVEPPKT